ncbi:MAG: hypothetical protein GEV11_30290 [Streptosporangiales bacterium]|nr:hypothetical protein [Streptosporangiales bacterium]
MGTAGNRDVRAERRRHRALGPAREVARRPRPPAARHGQRRVRAYYAPSLKGVDATRDEVVAAVELGYTAVKLRTGAGFATDAELVREVRRVVGDEVEIMVDANMGYDRNTALRTAGLLADLGVRWFEEPIRADSLSQYAREHSWLAERTAVPIAGGESLFTLWEYTGLFEPRAFDILQPDCVSVGGISEAKRVADMAGAWHVECAPHIACSSGTGIGLAAGLQLLLATPSAQIMEFDAYGGPGWDGLLKRPVEMVDGWVRAPEAPGLGVELADDAEERFALDVDAMVARRGGTRTVS